MDRIRIDPSSIPPAKMDVLARELWKIAKAANQDPEWRKRFEEWKRRKGIND